MHSTAKPKQKSYRQGSGLYFSAGLLLAMVLIITAFEWKTSYRIIETPVEFEEGVTTELDFKHSYIPPMPKPPVVGPEIKEVPDTTPDVVELPVDVLPPDTSEEDPGDSLIDDLLGSSNPFGREVTEMPDINQEAIPKGGYEAFYEYLYRNLRVPDHLLEQSGETRLVVSFVIDTNGQLTDIKLAEGTDKSLEKQVIKLLQNGPDWEPAWQGGRKVKARKALPVVLKTTNR
jgi:periplasmic protein TonB